MTKKEEKLSFKSILNQFMQKSLQSLIAVVAEQAEHLVEWIKNISMLKRMIRKLLVVLAFFIAGLAVLGSGAAQYLAWLYPNLDNGLSYILVGLVFIIIAALYMKMKE